MGEDLADASRTIEQVLDSTLESVDQAERLTLELARESGFGEEDLDRIGMSVRECMVNAVVHGNRYNSNKKMRLSLSRTPQRLTIRIVDRPRRLSTSHRYRRRELEIAIVCLVRVRSHVRLAAVGEVTVRVLETGETGHGHDACRRIACRNGVLVRRKRIRAKIRSASAAADRAGTRERDCAVRGDAHLDDAGAATRHRAR